MFKLTVIAVGKLKEPYWKDAVAEYSKRLAPYTILRSMVVAEVPFKSPSEAGAVMRAEAGAIRAKIPKGAFTVALDSAGRGMSSLQYAAALKREGEGGREIAFLIGGPLGLDPALSAECNLMLSLSPMTFTHGEAQAILMEQTYRAIAILMGKAYHY